jgi:hypothetical protein
MAKGTEDDRSRGSLDIDAAEAIAVDVDEEIVDERPGRSEPVKRERVRDELGEAQAMDADARFPRRSAAAYRLRGVDLVDGDGARTVFTWS